MAEQHQARQAQTQTMATRTFGPHAGIATRIMQTGANITAPRPGSTDTTTQLDSFLAAPMRI